MTGISVRGVSKSFGGTTVLDRVDLDVADGEFVCLLGPSGCGKSTLLRSIAGLESPGGGSIRLGDATVYDGDRRVDISPEKRRIGMVFQSFALWPHKTVFDNVAYPLRRQKTARNELVDRTREALSMVGLLDFADSYPGTLSGGQQQRVALARAVVGRPRLLLLDEPLSSLDTHLRARMRREIRAIQQRLGATALYVTHDKEDAGGLADRIAVLQQGTIVQQGSPNEVFARPRTPFVSEFVGFDNFLRATVTEAGDGVCGVMLAGSGNRLRTVTEHRVAEGDEVTVAFRSRLVRVHPEDEDHDPGNAFRGTVHSMNHLGDDIEVVIGDGAAEVVARVRPGHADVLTAGGAAVAVPPPEASVVVAVGAEPDAAAPRARPRPVREGKR
ncbi:ABC transporter ATP-binding protein [Actinomadura sp. LOL_016]|uniref:ABC transporter ATP-binding protein n=1 Tax=unclassified Actinomadura TaxID=2626254 RepID=UPI003A808608